MFEPCVAIVLMIWLGAAPPAGDWPKVFESEVLPDRELCEIHGAMRVRELKQDYGDLPVRYELTVQAPGPRL